ncbi:MAG TPA: DUF4163 domain-containing protein [Sphingomonas sp.]|jgi:hypothetical protein|nr:DUF4163 domain-containing protein [Sphingomonas sp.]
MAAVFLTAPAMAAPQLDYFYRTPARANAFPPLKRWFAADARAAKAKFDREVARERAASKKGNYPFNGWAATREWKVVTETPRFLSLSLAGYAFSNGAHGSAFFDGLLYDKTARQRVKPVALFVSSSGLSRTIRTDFCRALDKQREEKRGTKVSRNDMFGECIDPLNSTLILGSRSGRAFDRIGILIGPYEAGAYAEGTYDVTLPVTPAIIAQVKPAYRGAFAVAR